MDVRGQSTIQGRFFKRWMQLSFLLIGLILTFHASIAQAESPELVAPVIATPAHDAWSKVNSQSFTWTPVEHASSYNFRYIKSSSCTEEALASSEAVVVSTIMTTKTIDNMGDGMWCWQAQAVAAQGGHVDVGPWSRLATFTIDTQAPVVTVGEPQTAPRFSGTTDNPNNILSVLINGTPYPDIAVTVSQSPNEHGTYNWQLTIPALEAGSHMLGVRAVDRAGNETIGYADFQLVTALNPQGVSSTYTNVAPLPLVEAGPLVFIAPPISPAIVEPNKEVAYVTAQTTSQLITPAQIASPEETVEAATLSDSAVQTSSEGWKLFGITWYWWLAIVIAVTIAVWRLKSIVTQPQTSSLNEPRTVY